MTAIGGVRRVRFAMPSGCDGVATRDDGGWPRFQIDSLVSWLGRSPAVYGTEGCGRRYRYEFTVNLSSATRGTVTARSAN